MFSTDHWLLPILDQLRELLSDPITDDEAQALLDVLYERNRMGDLLKWIETRPVRWANFFAYCQAAEEAAKQVAEEEKRKRVEERKARRAAGLYPYLNVDWAIDLSLPRISDTCPDCGSREWKPIMYGDPSEDVQEDAEFGEVVLGGCWLDDPKRYCTSCFNSWPSKPSASKPTGNPEWLDQQILQSRSAYVQLSALADLPRDLGEPQVERAWARIDGSVEFLISLGEKKARMSKSLEYARIGGAPAYTLHFSCYERPEMSTLAAVAAVRFERSHEPERHNLFNDWKVIQEERRLVRAESNSDEFALKWTKEKRLNLVRLLKLARAFADQLPNVIGVRRHKHHTTFLVRFSWGTISVAKWQQSALESFEYGCESQCYRDTDPDRARDLACAAAMLAEFPRLDQQVI
jgi:hypothetical protein